MHFLLYPSHPISLKISVHLKAQKFTLVSVMAK